MAGSKSYAALGWLLFAVGNAMRFISMRFAAQTVLSGLGSLQFVLIPIASRALLGIRARLSTVLGVAVVLLGERGAAWGPGAGCSCMLRDCAPWAVLQHRAALLVWRGQPCAALAVACSRPPWHLHSSSQTHGHWTAPCPAPSQLPSPAGNVLIIMYGPPEVSFTLRQLREQWSSRAMEASGALVCQLRHVSPAAGVASHQDRLSPHTARQAHLCSRHAAPFRAS